MNVTNIVNRSSPRQSVMAAIALLSLAMINILNMAEFVIGTNLVIIKVGIFVLLLWAFLLYRDFYIPFKAIAFFCIVSALAAVNAIVVSYPSFVWREYALFVFFSFIPFVFGLCSFDERQFARYWLQLSVFFLLVIHLFLGAVSQGQFNYMRFGFIINFICAGLLLNYYYNPKLWKVLTFFYAAAVGLVLGHRGGTLVNVTMFLFLLYRLNYFSLKKGLVWMLAGCLFVGVAAAYDITLLGVLQKIQSALPSGVNSYFLRKMIFSLESDALDMSGREDNFELGYEIIRDNSFFYPSGLGRYDFLTGKGFPHNFFIDYYIVFGIFAVVISVFFGIKYIAVLRRASRDFSFLLGLLFIYSFVRLLTGGTFVYEPSLWLLVGLVYASGRRVSSESRSFLKHTDSSNRYNAI